MLSVKQGSIKYNFLKSLGMTRPGIDPRSPGPLANTLIIRPMAYKDWVVNKASDPITWLIKLAVAVHDNIYIYTKLSWKFCSILVARDAQSSSFWRFYWSHEDDKPHRTMRCRARLILSECYSPDLASESAVLDLPDLTWSSRFLQPKRNILNHMVTILWSNTPSPLTQQMFLVVSTALCLNPSP